MYTVLGMNHMIMTDIYHYYTLWYWLVYALFYQTCISWFWLEGASTYSLKISVYLLVYVSNIHCSYDIDLCGDSSTHHNGPYFCMPVPSRKQKSGHYLLILKQCSCHLQKALHLWWDITHGRYKGCILHDKICPCHTKFYIALLKSCFS